MSACRDSLPEDQRPVTADPVILAAADVLAVMRQRRDALAAASGARAVALASWPVICEGRDPAEIQAEYEELQERGRQRRYEAMREDDREPR